MADFMRGRGAKDCQSTISCQYTSKGSKVLILFSPLYGVLTVTSSPGSEAEDSELWNVECVLHSQMLDKQIGGWTQRTCA